METTRDAVLEIGTAELPASYIPGAVDDLRSAIHEELEAAGLPHRDPTVWATPRRLVVYIPGVPPRGEETVEEVRGPSESVAFQDGQPTRAAEGFARSQGVTVEDLVVRQDEKAAYVYALKRDPGGVATEILADAFSAAANSINFPRTMRWGTGEHAFARPVRWLAALWGDQVVPVELAGIRSGRRSLGPRYRPADIEVASAEQYTAAVEGTGVVLDPEVRSRMIVDACGRLTDGIGGTPVIAPELLREVSFLVEYPSVLLGSIPEDFLEVPRIVIETAMTSHLRFFPVEDESGGLAPYFLSVINGTEDMVPHVRPGNELVLNSRLADARFFWEEDKRRTPEDCARELGSVVFHEGLGSLADRTDRMFKMATAMVEAGLVPSEDADQLLRAVTLAKADLVTLMVSEFPDLQGRMGGEYARVWGEPESVCRALAEQYLPPGGAGELPETSVGMWLSLIDKVDHLVGGFRASLVGTGSEDPYGMRRAATAIARILGTLEEVKLHDVLTPALDAHGAGEDAGLRETILDFLTRRLARMMTDEGYAPEVVSGVLARGPERVPDAWERVRQVSEFLNRPEAEDMLVAWRRCHNLGAGGEALETLDPEEFPSREGRELAAALESLESTASDSLPRGDYLGFFSAAASIRGPVDAFLDAVMVMVPDEELKALRLGLLARIDELISAPMDWGELPG